MGIKVGMCGVGSFAQNIIPLFKHHPLVDHVVLCDLDAEKLAAKAEKQQLPDTCPSLDAQCARDGSDVKPSNAIRCSDGKIAVRYRFDQCL